MNARLSLPQRGREPGDILGTMDAYREGDARWRDGKCFSLVYFAGEAHEKLLIEAHEKFFMENALNPMAFKSLKRMEAEVVQMTASMFHGPPEAVGTMTSGGTESILMAVKTYRERARAKWPWIRRPEIVAPRTIHVAFDKAAHYFGLTLRHAPISIDGRVDIDAMRGLINRNTVMLAASAPHYPHGVLDVLRGHRAVNRRRLLLPVDVPAALAQSIGRWGNWFNQELYGKPTSVPWALQIDSANGYASGTTFHPTFLYESLWALALCGVLLLVQGRYQLAAGRLLGVYLIGYGTGRFWIEGLRIDRAHSLGGLRLNQWVALSAVVALSLIHI